MPRRRWSCPARSDVTRLHQRASSRRHRRTELGSNRAPAPAITVRGLGSLSLNTQPLVYIDGVRVNNDVSSGPQSPPAAWWSPGSTTSPRKTSRAWRSSRAPPPRRSTGPRPPTASSRSSPRRAGPAASPQISFTIRQGTNWFQNPEGRIPTNFGLDPVTGAVVSQNLVQQESDRGTPIWKNGYSGSYSLSATRRLQRGAVLSLGQLR